MAVYDLALLFCGKFALFARFLRQRAVSDPYPLDIA